MNKIIRRANTSRTSDGVALDGIYSLNQLNNRQGHAPNAVTNLTATSSDAALNLSWSAPSSEFAITNYLVEYVANGVVDSKLTQSTNASYTLTGLTNGTSYAVRVAAISAAGTGDYSVIINAAPTAYVSPTITGTGTIDFGTGTFSDPWRFRTARNQSVTLTMNSPTKMLFQGSPPASASPRTPEFNKHSLPGSPRLVTTYCDKSGCYISFKHPSLGLNNYWGSVMWLDTGTTVTVSRGNSSTSHTWDLGFEDLYS